MISSPIWLSRLPVGSSASRMRGPADDGAGDGDALLLAAGELRREVVHARAQADPLERGLRQLAPLARLASVRYSSGISTLSATLRSRDQVEGLEDEAELAVAQPRQRAVAGRLATVVAADRDRAAAWARPAAR